jgi:hypothetical protein
MEEVCNKSKSKDIRVEEIDNVTYFYCVQCDSTYAFVIRI